MNMDESFFFYGRSIRVAPYELKNGQNVLADMLYVKRTIGNSVGVHDSSLLATHPKLK